MVSVERASLSLSYFYRDFVLTKVSEMIYWRTMKFIRSEGGGFKSKGLWTETRIKMYQCFQHVLKEKGNRRKEQKNVKLQPLAVQKFDQEIGQLNCGPDRITFAKKELFHSTGKKWKEKKTIRLTDTEITQRNRKKGL